MNKNSICEILMDYKINQVTFGITVRFAGRDSGVAELTTYSAFLSEDNHLHFLSATSKQESEIYS